MLWLGASVGDAAGLGSVSPSRLLLDGSDEAVAPSVHGLDESLGPAVVAQCPADLLDAGGERRFAHELVPPDAIEQLLLGDEQVPALEEEHHDIEGLGFEIDTLTESFDDELVTVDDPSLPDVAHGPSVAHPVHPTHPTGGRYHRSGRRPFATGYPPQLFFLTAGASYDDEYLRWRRCIGWAPPQPPPRYAVYSSLGQCRRGEMPSASISSAWTRS